jgi:hypothetical protein
VKEVSQDPAHGMVLAVTVFVTALRRDHAWRMR